MNIASPACCFNTLTVLLCLMRLSSVHLLVSSDAAKRPRDGGGGGKADSPSDGRQLPFDEAYQKGKQAYLENNWSECIAKINQALQSYKKYWLEVVRCRRQCHREADAAHLLVTDGQLAHYERAIRDTLCLMKCQPQHVVDREAVGALRAVENEIEQKTPYDYLQMCYFKVDDLQNAASSAYTFLLYNPDHEVMKTNFQYYASQSKVDHQLIKNLEVRPYQDLFLKGNDAYNKKNFKEVVEIFEQAVSQYYEEEDTCRLLCEGHFERAPALDLIMTIANHFTYSLRCKQRCQKTLAFIYGEDYHNFLPSQYHYLQYAYYQIGEIRKACEAAASYLLFHPTDDAMLHNKDFYTRSELGITDEAFMPKKEVVDYIQRDRQEKRLLEFVKENFRDSSTTSKKEHNHKKVKGPIAKFEADEYPELNSQNATKADLVLTEGQLNGTDRFAADGFINQKECEQLMELAKEAAVHGDGYNGRRTPHTKFETFEGLTVGRAAVLIKLGHLRKGHVKLLLDISERGRQYVEHYFRLKQHSLYFSYTHLVCRTATPDAPLNRSDLSHPVHADNCVLTMEGTCIKAKPAFTWRDYSSILYLNDDFDGGDFIFAENKDTIQASIRPKCGRMVGFSAGQENLHGVQAVVKGRRCALAMWFTLDHNHREKERFLAIQVLNQLEQQENNKKATLAMEGDYDGPKFRTEKHTAQIEQTDENAEDYLHSVENSYQLETLHGYSNGQQNHQEL